MPLQNIWCYWKQIQMPKDSTCRAYLDLPTWIELTSLMPDTDQQCRMACSTGHAVLQSGLPSLQADVCGWQASKKMEILQHFTIIMVLSKHEYISSQPSSTNLVHKSLLQGLLLHFDNAGPVTCRSMGSIKLKKSFIYAFLPTFVLSVRRDQDVSHP